MNQRDFEDLISIVSSRLMRLREDQNGILHEGQIEEVLDRELNHHGYDADRNTALSRLERNFEIVEDFLILLLIIQDSWPTNFSS